MINIYEFSCELHVSINLLSFSSHLQVNFVSKFAILSTVRELTRLISYTTRPVEHLPLVSCRTTIRPNLGAHRCNKSAEEWPLQRIHKSRPACTPLSESLKFSCIKALLC